MFYREVIVLCLVAAMVSAERGCPYPEEIEPCTCRQSGVAVLLDCSKMVDTEELLRVFKNVKRHHFYMFTLEKSILQYIPHAIFDDVEVKQMKLREITFMHLFNQMPSDPGLRWLDVESVKVLAGWDWSKLSAFKNLDDLYMQDVKLKGLSADFRSNKKLKFLTLIKCSIKKLRDDEFADFADLEEFDLSSDTIVDIKRTMFPRRTKLSSISMRNNRISTIPKDFFSDMPNLKHAIFKGNLISVLPEATILPIVSNRGTIFVDENPIKCDCLFDWLMQYSRRHYSGECYAPKALHGKNFYYLKTSDIRC